MKDDSKAKNVKQLVHFFKLTQEPVLKSGYLTPKSSPWHIYGPQ